MKFILFFGLLALIASCYAACDCSAADQPCLDKCVTSANSCVVKCQKESAGESCEQACFAANWPSMTSENYAKSTTQVIMTHTMATPTSSKVAIASASARVTASVARPSPSPSLRPTVNNNSTSDADILSSFGWASLLMTSIFFYFL
ncbi:hypothetical protein G6F56_012228 [Rhizopus delemar]|nr:hypothetical protein G6F56_012228 [Rhizopus delemar]